MAIIDENYEDV